MCNVVKEMPRALTTEECEGIVKAFIKGAVIAQTAGIDGVEIHAAHGYLINEFLSPYTNKRTDKYGAVLKTVFGFWKKSLQESDICADRIIRFLFGLVQMNF